MSRSILNHSWQELPYPFVIEAESKYENEFYIIRDILDYGDTLATIVNNRLTNYDRDQLIIIKNAFNDRNTIMKSLENFLNNTSKAQYEGIWIHRHSVEGTSPINDLCQKINVMLSDDEDNQ